MQASEHSTRYLAALPHGIFDAKRAVPERDHEAPAFEADSPARTSADRPTR
jgi:hypothetical protein